MISVKTLGPSKKLLDSRLEQQIALELAAHIESAFPREERTGAPYQKYFSIGSTSYAVTSHSFDALHATTQALAHSEEAKRKETNALTIYVASGTNRRLRPLFAYLNTLSKNRVVRLQHEHCMFWYNPGLAQSLPTFSFLDRAADQAIYWVADEKTIPWYGIAAPLRTIFHWHFTDRNIFMMHAACIGRKNTGILIVGKGGKGKTSTSLSFLHNKKLSYLADDYLLIDTRTTPRALSLFSSAKIDAPTLLRFPELRTIAHRKAEPHEKKTVFFFYPDKANQVARTMAIGAIIVPFIAHADRTTFRSIAGKEALLAAAPSTIFQLQPESTKSNSFANMAALAKRVPSFAMELGSNPREIAGSIENFLETLL